MILLPLLLAMAQPAGEDTLVAALEQSQRRVEAAVAGLSEKDAARIPGPEKWPVLYVVEHLAVAEELLLAQVKHTVLTPAAKVDSYDPASARKTDEAIRTRFPDRSQKVKAPAAFVPTGRFATLKEALAAFQQRRAETLRLARNPPGDLRLYRAMHPVGAPLDGHQWLLAIAGHTLRHAAQIDEIRKEILQ